MRKTLVRAAVVLGATALMVPVPVSPASAHVTATPNEATSQYFRTALRVGHGCEGSPTVAVRVQIPEGVENPRAEVVTGWDVEVVHEDLAEPVEGSHGEQITDRVAEIAWVGGSLSDEQFQEFGLNFRITEQAPEVLWFPTIQECEEGEHRWIDIPPSVDEWDDLDEPAPYVINAVAAAEEPTDADETGAELTETSTVEEAQADGSGGTDPLTVVALIAGLLGIGFGIGALAYTRRRTSPQPGEET